MQRGAIVGEDIGVEGIVFGALALGQSEVPDLGRVQSAHGLGEGVAGGNQAFFIAAGGFTNNLHLAKGLHLLEQLSAAFGGVIQEVLATLELELEGGFSRIHAVGIKNHEDWLVKAG